MVDALEFFQALLIHTVTKVCTIINMLYENNSYPYIIGKLYHLTHKCTVKM